MKTLALLALTLNVAGALALFYAFQATSSDIKLLSQTDGTRYLCFGNTSLMIKPNANGGLSMGPRECPDLAKARPAALVNIEKPWLITVGLLLTVLGFAIQFFVILFEPSPGQKKHR